MLGTKNKSTTPTVKMATQASNPSSPESSSSITKTSYRDIRELIQKAKTVRRRSSQCTTDIRNDDDESARPEHGGESVAIPPSSGMVRQDDESSNKIIKKTTSKETPLFGLGGDKRQKKIVITKFSKDPRKAIEVQIGDIPELVSENHVVIKVTASTVSVFDCLIRKGVSYEMVDLPITPGMDVVGNIIKCGENVTTFRVGDRVAALVRFGGNARYVNVLSSNLVEVPRSCDAAEAVCVVSTYMTAYQSLRLVTNDNFSLVGKRILITGGLDAVGQALVQLCQKAGASEIYATAPILRHKYLQGVLGVHPLLPDPEDWPPSIVKGRMHAVFDGTCQAPHDALTTDGVLISLGESALMNQESTPGLLGAPIAAYWARLKGNVMPNTKIYDLWDSFTGDKNAFKVRSSNMTNSCKSCFRHPLPSLFLMFSTGRWILRFFCIC
jgi:D-arabinose 1-dehydrogenase-like Zn-dependent alcohol dehydrogenase